MPPQGDRMESRAKLRESEPRGYRFTPEFHRVELPKFVMPPQGGGMEYTMKKKLVILLAAVLLLSALPLSLVSCSQASRLLRMEEGSRAAAFFRLVNGKSAMARSASMEQTFTTKLDLNGVAYEQVTDVVMTYILERTDMTHLEQAKTTVVSGGMAEVIYEDRGYANGEMFLYSKEGGAEVRLKSAVTAEEYNAFLGELNAEDSEILVGEGYCSTMTCVQNEDKTWTATYEGFTEAGMEPFLKMLAGIEYLVTAEHKLKDVRMTYSADAKLYPTESRIDFIFETNPDAAGAVPVISTHTRYKGWNNTVLAAPYDTEGFTEVEDARWVDRFLTSLRRRETAAEGRFTVKSVTDARYAGGGSNRVELDGEMTFWNRNGMEVSFDYDQAGYRYALDYAKGNMKVTVRDSQTGETVTNETQPMTDGEAQSLVAQTMNSESISLADLADVTVKDAANGICRFTLSEAVKNSLREVYQYQLGGDILEFNGYVEAAVKDGKLTAYTYHVYASFRVDKQHTLFLNVDFTVTFLELTESGEAV